MDQSKFHTIVDIPDYSWETGYSRKNIFMGSCFTENIGSKMANLNFDVNINPFGILYNPLSVANGLQYLVDNREIADKDLVQHNGLWHSFYHHGKFSNTDKTTTLRNINNSIHASAEYLRNADFLFITFGTAWIYRFKETGKTVANCHKIPAKQFTRERLTVNEIVTESQHLLSSIRKINSELKVVFTVSPIRHWKDGAIENQRSKATLLLAVEEIIENNKEYCTYFPSYEIVMDELRDYRFYSEDMIHISDAATKHIWEKFRVAFISKKSRTISLEISKVKAASLHRPFNKFTKEHLKFLQKQLTYIIQIEKKYPAIDLEVEKKIFLTQIDEIKSSNLLNQ